MCINIIIPVNLEQDIKSPRYMRKLKNFNLNQDEIAIIKEK